VASLTGLISDGLRRSLLLQDACADRDDTGMLVLDPGDGVDLANQIAEQWVDELGIGTRAGTTLPLVIRTAARQARAVGGRGEGQLADGSTGLATARVRTKAGRWVIVRASLLGESTTAPVAVLLEAARPAEMAPLLADLYGLTPQERRVTESVAQGLPTRQIANRLRMSAYTVQDHLRPAVTRPARMSMHQPTSSDHTHMPLLVRSIGRLQTTRRGSAPNRRSGMSIF
jgi:Bacterial regulatory proteins, luxR family